MPVKRLPIFDLRARIARCRLPPVSKFKYEVGINHGRYFMSMQIANQYPDRFDAFAIDRWENEGGCFPIQPRPGERYTARETAIEHAPRKLCRLRGDPVMVMKGMRHVPPEARFGPRARLARRW